MFFCSRVGHDPGCPATAYYLLSLHQHRQREVHATALQYGQLASVKLDGLSLAPVGLQATAHVDSVRTFDIEACNSYLYRIARYIRTVPVERDGPIVQAPKTTGFGSRMLQKALAAELSAEVTLDFAHDG